MERWKSVDEDLDKFEQLLSNCNDVEATEKELEIIFKETILPADKQKYFHVHKLSKLAQTFINNNPTDNQIIQLLNLLQLFEIKLNQQKYQYTYFDIFRTLVLIANRFKVNTFTKMWARKRWINICLNANTDYIYRTYFKLKKINPENEIKEIIFDENDKIKLEFKKEEWKPERLSDWFINRYDLITSGKIIKGLSGRITNKENTDSLINIEKKPWIILFISSVFFTYFYFSYFDLSGLLIWDKRNYLPIEKWGFFHYAELIPAITGIIFLTFLLIDRACCTKRMCCSK